jgi:hypothetical protein
MLVLLQRKTEAGLVVHLPLYRVQICRPDVIIKAIDLSAEPVVLPPAIIPLLETSCRLRDSPSA